MEDIFLASQTRMLKYGFWTEEPKTAAFWSIEKTYKPEIIKIWSIQDLIIKDNKILIKWKKRDKPLTDKEYTDKYN